MDSIGLSLSVHGSYSRKYIRIAVEFLYVIGINYGMFGIENLVCNSCTETHKKNSHRGLWGKIVCGAFY